MSAPAILISIASVMIMLGSIPDKVHAISLAQYVLLLAIFVEVGCMHETLKEK